MRTTSACAGVRPFGNKPVKLQAAPRMLALPAESAFAKSASTTATRTLSATLFGANATQVESGAALTAAPRIGQANTSFSTTAPPREDTCASVTTV